MAKKKNGQPPTMSVPSPKDDDLKAVYAKMRKKFTAAELQKYTEIE